MAESLDHLLHETRRIPPQTKREGAHIPTFKEYEALYKKSLEESDAFWLEEASALQWEKKPTVACQWEWNSKKRVVNHTFFADGKLNVTLSCLDRHLEESADKAAIIWQGEKEEEKRTLTYRELHREVCTFAAALRNLGIKKGDRVCIYLPMIPELAIATLACARIGAIHSVIFGGFSAESISYRVKDTGCTLMITTDKSVRGGKELRFKETVDQALQNLDVKTLVIKRSSSPCPFDPKRNFWYHEVSKEGDGEAEIMDAEEPLFILYTSGSTGKPKGIVHTQAGYLLYAALTHRMVFNIQDDDIYWCTADIGWITGHSYVIYGPLANGATTLMFEGVPTYPDPGRFWKVIEEYQVTAFYTAPTAIRALISCGNSWPEKYDLKSLRLLGTVGEPINPEAWMWYYEVIGGKRCPVVDTWWQTETGGIMITPLPYSHTLKPGSATRPFFGVDPVVVKTDGTPCTAGEGGSLCIKRPWPGMMRTTWGDHNFFIDTYFSTFDNLYFSGDGCRVDSEGDYWLLGRIDDVVNISGHRIGTAEIESALVSHPSVAEAACVPIPHPIKGQGLYAFVTPIADKKADSALKEQLIQHIRKEIGPIATPETIQFATELPKTRSGKIMRRILRKIAEKDLSNLGDLTTLADATVIEKLIKEQP